MQTHLYPMMVFAARGYQQRLYQFIKVPNNLETQQGRSQGLFSLFRGNSMTPTDLLLEEQACAFCGAALLSFDDAPSMPSVKANGYKLA